MAELTLLPRKVFEIKLKSGEIIKGQYSLWSIKRFTDRRKIPLSQLSNILQLDEITMDDLCQLLLCAVEYVCRKENKPFNYRDDHACDWIEEMGGFGSDQYLALTNHSKTEDESPVGDDEKKKSVEWSELERICYSAGLKPDEFWSSTLDEAIYFFRGWVDGRRWIRNAVDLLHCSLVDVKNRVNILDALGLPFDDEVRNQIAEGEKENVNSMVADYYKLIESGVFKNQEVGIA